MLKSLAEHTNPLISISQEEIKSWYSEKELKAPKKTVVTVKGQPRVAKTKIQNQIPGQAIVALLKLIRANADFNEMEVLKQLKVKTKAELTQLLNDWNTDSSIIFKVI